MITIFLWKYKEFAYIFATELLQEQVITFLTFLSILQKFDFFHILYLNDKEATTLQAIQKHWACHYYCECHFKNANKIFLREFHNCIFNIKLLLNNELVLKIVWNLLFFIGYWWDFFAKKTYQTLTLSMYSFTIQLNVFIVFSKPIKAKERQISCILVKSKGISANSSFLNLLKT